MNGTTCFVVFKTIKPHFVSIKHSTIILILLIISTNVFFSIFSYHTKSHDQSQIDLPKCGYKTNRQVQNLDFLLLVGKPIKHMSLINNFKIRKLRICSTSPKMLANPFIFSSKCGEFIGKFSNSFLIHVHGLFFPPQNGGFSSQKNH
jgi:hypothetical protein